jgi:hypothetical protein
MRGQSIFLALAALCTLTIGPAAAAISAQDEAGDAFVAAALSTPYDRIVDGGLGRRTDGAPFMVANDGSAATFVIGCESACTRIHLVVRAAGLPELVAQSDREHPHSLTFRVPANYSRSLSNFEVDIDLACNREDGCAVRWAMLASGGPRSATARGLPRPPSEAEWNAGVASSDTTGDLQWLARPSGDDLRFFYPSRAWSLGREGSVRLQCLVVAGGALRCRATGETPRTGGFGDAAVRMSTMFRVRETDSNGQPTRNRRVIIPIQFGRPH